MRQIHFGLRWVFVLIFFKLIFSGINIIRVNCKQTCMARTDSYNDLKNDTNWSQSLSFRYIRIYFHHLRMVKALVTLSTWHASMAAGPISLSPRCSLPAVKLHVPSLQFTHILLCALPVERWSCYRPLEKNVAFVLKNSTMIEYLLPCLSAGC